MVGVAKVARMNGVHDMGGMHGMGAIEHENNEPVFHAPLGRAGIRATRHGSQARGTSTPLRRSREPIPAAEYLRMSYYEKWIAASSNSMLNVAWSRARRSKAASPAPGSPKAVAPLTADKVASVGQRCASQPGT